MRQHWLTWQIDRHLQLDLGKSYANWRFSIAMLVFERVVGNEPNLFMMIYDDCPNGGTKNSRNTTKLMNTSNENEKRKQEKEHDEQRLDNKK